MSSFDILTTFYNRIMPLFQPQAEALVSRLSLDDLNRLAFRYTFSVNAMIEVSHLIEDTILGNPGRCELHVSFQQLSRLQEQEEKYSQLSKASTFLCLYGITDATFAFFDRPNVQVIDTANTPLVDYWFVVAYGPGFHQTLLAQEIKSLQGDDRYYEGFYTFDINITYQLLLVLHQLYPKEIKSPTPPEAWE